MSVIACLGDYARVPYYFEKLDIRVFCMEELCCCLKENACLLGNEIMEEALLKFIGEECHVPQLARELYPLVYRKGNLSTFVAMILEYVGFYDPEEVEAAESTLKKTGQLPDYEKKKIRIDHLVQRGKYRAALDEYERLYETMPKDAGCGSVLHNMAVVYAHLMMYQKAAELFKQAYEVSGWDESFIAYLGANRFLMTDREYVDFAAGLTKQYHNEMKLEKILEEVNREWENTPESLGIANIQEWRLEGRNQKYEEECAQILDTLKNEYRTSAQV